MKSMVMGSVPLVNEPSGVPVRVAVLELAGFARLDHSVEGREHLAGRPGELVAFSTVTVVWIERNSLYVIARTDVHERIAAVGVGQSYRTDCRCWSRSLPHRRHVGSIRMSEGGFGFVQSNSSRSNQRIGHRRHTHRAIAVPHDGEGVIRIGAREEQAGHVRSY